MFHRIQTPNPIDRRKGKDEEEDAGKGLFFMYVAVDDFDERTFRLFERFGEVLCHLDSNLSESPSYYYS